MKVKNIKMFFRLCRSFARSQGKQKIFCVGCNKTGTTSLAQAFKNFGYVVGNQYVAEMIGARDWARRDFRRLIRYCRTAQVFQDVPFSRPYTYQAVDAAFPGSKFILTVRDTSEQWYNSLIRFHSKMWSPGRIPPTKQDLQNAVYHYKGLPWDSIRQVFNAPEDDPYQKETLIRYYENHNATVQEYFRHRSNDLLVLNVAEPGSYRKLCRFLNRSCDKEEFPWENKT